MNSKLLIRCCAMSLLLALSLTSGWGQPVAAPQLAIDPATGLPIARPSIPWKDPGWKDPAKTLNITFDNLPIDEIVRYLRDQFGNDFDIVAPNGYAPTNLVADTRQGGWVSPERFDLGSQDLKLHLRNVTASEIFHAMNLEFEAENAPLRWELTLNGKRPTALLRVVPELLPPAPQPPPPQPQPVRTVFFVGDLIGPGNAGFESIDQVAKIISEVWRMAYDNSPGVKFHKEAQLLIVTGSPDQLDFIQQTLSALKEKVALARQRQSSSASSAGKTEQSKAGNSSAERVEH